MTDDIKHDRAGDVGVYPDPSTYSPLEPRSTADFINDVWNSRKSPVYALHPKEIEVLQSRTVRGWFWRLILSLVRYSRPNKFSVQPDAYDCADGLVDGDYAHHPESERTMEHYLAVATKFTPELAAIKTPSYPDTCGCTEFHQDKIRNPQKRTAKKTQKPKPRTTK
jgi:hypothetical protein